MRRENRNKIFFEISKKFGPRGDEMENYDNNMDIWYFSWALLNGRKGIVAQSNARGDICQRFTIYYGLKKMNGEKIEYRDIDNSIASFRNAIWP